MTLGEYIKHKNTSEKKFCKLIPCTQVYVNYLVRGIRTPSYKMALRIENVTDGQVKKENWYPNE